MNARKLALLSTFFYALTLGLSFVSANYYANEPLLCPAVEEEPTETLNGEWFGGAVYRHGESCPGHWEAVKLHVWQEGSAQKASIDYPKKNQFDIPLSFDPAKNIFSRSTPDGVQIELKARFEESELSGDYVQNGEKIGSFQFVRNSGKVFKRVPIPDFNFSLIDSDQSVQNTDLAGKYVLIDFWFTACKICRAEMPNLHEAYEKYGKKNFTILSVSIDQKLEDVRAFRKENWPMPWLNSHLEKSWDSPVLKEFDFKGSPTLYLISPEGKVLAGNDQLLGENLEKTLAKHLN